MNKRVVSLYQAITLITLKQIIMRKLKVNSKLAVRTIKRQDATTKVGLSIAVGFILPICITMFTHILSNSATITFGNF